MNARSDALNAPAVARNRDPILSVLRDVLPSSGTVLEIASGTGEHSVHFARALRNLTWQPTDLDAVMLPSISAHRALAELPNLLAPLELDVDTGSWPISHADAVVCINMLHIAHWSAAEGLMAAVFRCSFQISSAARTATAIPIPRCDHVAAVTPSKRNSHGEAATQQPSARFVHSSHSSRSVNAISATKPISPPLSQALAAA
jgi:hypothetical protein